LLSSNGVRPSCTFVHEDGRPCASCPRRGTSRCAFHPLDEEGKEALRSWGAKGYRAATKKPDIVKPDISLGEMARLNLKDDASLERARTGVWQHLLAGSLDPHTAKAALSVADTLHAQAPRKSSSTVKDLVKHVLESEAPPTE
jgi:hypothetical protein